MAQSMPLLLLPGLLCDAGLWQHQLLHLQDICDPQVPDLTQDDSMAAMAQRVLNAAPARFALAGLSMGGYLAFEILRQAPERVTGVALIDTSAAADTDARADERRRSIEETRRHERFLGMTPRMLSRFVHPDHARGPIGQEVCDMAKRIGGEAFIRQQRAIIGRPDSRSMLSRITVPTAVIVGAEDRMTPPEEAAIMAAAIGGATLDVIAECGHLAPLEQPEATTRIMRRWLADVTVAAQGTRSITGYETAMPVDQAA